MSIFNQSFTHPTNSPVYKTKIVLEDVANEIGKVRYTITFTRSSFSWGGFNLNNAGTNPKATLDGTKTSSTPAVYRFIFSETGADTVVEGYYKIDFRTGGDDGGSLSKLLKTGTFTVTPGVSNSFVGRNYPFSVAGMVTIGTQTFTPAAWPKPVWSTAASLPAVIRDVVYTTESPAATLSASPVTVYEITDGSLPVGLSLSTSTGVITGTPTTLGTSTFTVRATNNNVDTSSESRTFTLTVNPPAPVFTDSTVASPAIRGVSYSDGVEATDATSYSVRNSANTGAGTLPAGLSLNTSTGAITGTPTTLGNTSFRIRATNSVGAVTDTPTLSITVNPPAPVFTDEEVTSPAIRGVSYSDGVVASDAASYSVFSGALPTGLSLNTSTGVISGTPTTLQTATFTIRATNVTGTDTTPTLSIVVNPPAPVFTDSVVAPLAIAGVPYSDGVVASDAASYSVFSGSLPTGLSLNTSTGAITGTPTTAGVYTFVLRSTNVTGSTNTSTLSITVLSSVRVWNGTAFVTGVTQVRSGSSWVYGNLRVWNGLDWIQPS
jgi:hypothetical protein